MTSDKSHRARGAETPEQLRAEIARARENLGETVAALAAKADVKSRAKDKAGRVKAGAAAKAQRVLHVTRDRAEETGGKARQRADQIAEDIRPTEGTVSDGAGTGLTEPVAGTYDTRTPMRRATPILAFTVGAAVAAAIVWARRRGSGASGWRGRQSGGALSAFRHRLAAGTSHTAGRKHTLASRAREATGIGRPRGTGMLNRAKEATAIGRARGTGMPDRAKEAAAVGRARGEGMLDRAQEAVAAGQAKGAGMTGRMKEIGEAGRARGIDAWKRAKEAGAMGTGSMSRVRGAGAKGRARGAGCIARTRRWTARTSPFGRTRRTGPFGRKARKRAGGGGGGGFPAAVTATLLALLVIGRLRRRRHAYDAGPAIEETAYEHRAARHRRRHRHGRIPEQQTTGPWSRPPAVG
ncbi:DUF3618 domain-containing protein [Spongiactinospora gelatinilytica]|uniref:DUF3618 domain-containing protein n=1 Tax=Spongiactinospora gelatinilytica TaxID=2666298 RepID=UPI0018F5B1D9|nr:DUF3618 domain-containing protein [Spongiactinospora gelatinilytica]